MTDSKSTHDLRLPESTVLHAALRKITERLAAEIHRPSDAPPAWSELEWQLARAVCAIHGVSALFADLTSWKGPPGWQRFLLEQRVQTERRHVKVQELLRQLDATLRAADTPAVALKGAELHALGLYRPGERPMADVDLLARPADRQRVTAALHSLGFAQIMASSRHLVFQLGERMTPGILGEHAGSALKIELHERIAETLAVRLEDITGVVLPAQLHAGLNRYASKAALLIHLLLHAAGSMQSRALRMIQLNDIARLARSMSDEDWDLVLTIAADGRRFWWAAAPLILASRYIDQLIPARILSQLRSTCPKLLERFARRCSLSECSFSHLWIDAFPGLEWSRSVGEAVRLMMRRVWPDQELLQLRQVVARTQLAAAHSEWDRMSQGRRVVHWIVARRTRTETLYNVRAALAQAT